MATQLYHSPFARDENGRVVTFLAQYEPSVNQAVVYVNFYDERLYPQGSYEVKSYDGDTAAVTHACKLFEACTAADLASRW